MTENDSIPSLENLANDKAAWLYFCPWYMNYLTSEQNNPVENLIEIYQSDYCITLDELPDLKKYPINSSDEPAVTTVTTKKEPTQTTTSATTTKTPGNAEEIIYGDLDGSKDVDLTDLSLLSLVILKENECTDIISVVGDVDANGEINVADLSLLKQYVMKREGVVLGPKK